MGVTSLTSVHGARRRALRAYRWQCGGGNCGDSVGGAGSSDDMSLHTTAMAAARAEAPSSTAAPAPRGASAAAVAAAAAAGAYGYKRRDTYAADLAFTVDAGGNEALVTADGGQVMMQWERPLMVACVDALRLRSGVDDVLEIGFGLGFSATAIQGRCPRSHTIVDCSPVVMERAREWASGYGWTSDVGRQGSADAADANGGDSATRLPQPGIHLVEGRWQEALGAMARAGARFTAVFFDDFPLQEAGGASPDARGSDTSAAAAGAMGAGSDATAPAAPPRSRWHDIVNTCCDTLMGVGGRITGYMAQPVAGLKRADCSVSFTPFAVSPPPHCGYWGGHKEACVPLLCKVWHLPVSGGGAAMADAAASGGQSSSSHSEPKRRRVEVTVQAAATATILKAGANTATKDSTQSAGLSGACSHRSPGSWTGGLLAAATRSTSVRSTGRAGDSSDGTAATDESSADPASVSETTAQRAARLRQLRARRDAAAGELPRADVRAARASGAAE